MLHTLPAYHLVIPLFVTELDLWAGFLFSAACTNLSLWPQCWFSAVWTDPGFWPWHGFCILWCGLLDFSVTKNCTWPEISTKWSPLSTDTFLPYWTSAAQLCMLYGCSMASFTWIGQVWLEVLPTKSNRVYYSCRGMCTPPATDSAAKGEWLRAGKNPFQQRGYTIVHNRKCKQAHKW